VFETLLAGVAIVAGGIAAVAGFGIGSLLTPAFALRVDPRLAVAAVSVPHFAGTALRFWLLGGRIDRGVLWSFGITSAAGGLIGALVHGWIRNESLAIVFGVLLLFVAASELSGLARRMRFHGPTAWIAGAASGLFGGLVGNQGGIRSAALLGFNLPKEEFIGTATAIGLFVDAARMPVYLWSQSHDVLSLWKWLVITTAGVLAGTVFGSRVLTRIPQTWFRPLVAIVVATLGAAMLLMGLRVQ
jgi:uncharacterized membrane protein YfcA